MTPEQFVNILLTICGTALTAISGFFVLEFREMRKSVEELNVKIATIIEKIETHEERIERIEVKLDGKLNS